MQDFPANSAKARSRSQMPGPGPIDQPEKIESITTAKAVRRKRGLGRRFKDAFIEGDPRESVDYALRDIVVPTAQQMLFETLQGLIDHMIYGNSRPRRGSRAPSYSNPGNEYRGNVSYNTMSTSANRPQNTRTLPRSSRERFNFNDVIVSDRRIAEDVLDNLFEVLSRYGSVPVAVLYSLTDIRTEHTDELWGWTSLRGARVVPKRDGFLIDLPEPEPLNPR